MSTAPVGVVLAAGSSRRMGRPKAGLVRDGRTFLAHVIGALRGGGVADVVVVAGEHRDAIVAALPPGEAIAVLDNPDPDRGQLSSLKIALAHVARAHPDATALVVALVDHPAVYAGTVAALLAALARSSPPAIVLPSHDGRRGHPVVFGRAVWRELAEAPDEIGARVVVRADPARVAEVAVDDPGILIDVDTPEDLSALLSRAPRDARSPR